MITLPQSILEELHRANSDASTIVLMEIPNYDIRKARNNEDVVWNGKTWGKFWFEIEVIEDTTTGKIPELQIVACDIGGIMQNALDQYDDFADCTMTIYLVNSNCLGDLPGTPGAHGYAIAEWTFDIMKPIVDPGKTVALKLSVQNPLLCSYPSWQLHKTLCQYVQFKGPLCGLGSSVATCNRTLAACTALGNEARFGGQLGLSS